MGGKLLLAATLAFQSLFQSRPAALPLACLRLKALQTLRSVFIEDRILPAVHAVLRRDLNPFI